MKYKYYRLYGLTIESAIELEHLLKVDLVDVVDVTLNFVETKEEYNLGSLTNEIYSSPGLLKNGLPYLTVWKQPSSEREFLILRYTNGKGTAYFISDKNGDRLTICSSKEVPYGDLLSYLLGPVIGCILRLKKKICLHASVVYINGRAIAFIGEKTAGKSTLVASLGLMGYPILTDDIAVLVKTKNQLLVQSGYPRLRLWKNSIQHFPSIDYRRLKPVLARLEKYFVPLSLDHNSQPSFQQRALPLSGILYLKPRNDGNICQLSNCTPAEGFLMLKKNIYASYMLDDDLKEREFEILGDLANRRILHVLDRPDDLQVLPKICELIVEKAITLNDAIDIR